MKIKVVFNADDFGISHGVNLAIVKAHEEGVLTSASLMVNQKYTEEAVQLAKKHNRLKIGLHVDLTNEWPVLSVEEIPLLVDRKTGKLKHGFLKLLMLSVFRRSEFSSQVESEIRAQVNKFNETGLFLSHIDSHRHVHMIPAVFKVMQRVKEEFNIPRIRVMNEDAFNTIRFNKSKTWLFDGALIKYIVLRFLCFLNGYSNGGYFYTILFTGKIGKAQFCNVKIPKGFDFVEVMIHPGMPEIDRLRLEDVWDKNLLSHYRTVELNTLLDKEIANGIS